METKKVLTRNNEPTDELQGVATKSYKGIGLEYNEVYYLDYEVDEESGLVNSEKMTKHYTKNQVNRNMKALKSAYLIAKGAAAPEEIIDFRAKYLIPASTFSVILGFSKNTISNIENEGVTSLPTGRLIKMCLDDKSVITHYISLCDSIESGKKDELCRKLMEEEF